MNRTVVKLTDLERAILTDFADGDTPTQIAKQTGVGLDTVTGVLTRRASMSRPRARDLVADPDPREQSPLTAPLPGKNGAKATDPAPARPPAPARRVIAEPELAATEAHGAATTIRAATDPPPAPPPPAPSPEPAPAVVETITLADALDGMDELSCQIRDLVVGLAQTLARRHHARLLRLRVADLEAQLERARGELAACEKDGGTA